MRDHPSERPLEVARDATVVAMAAQKWADERRAERNAAVVAAVRGGQQPAAVARRTGLTDVLVRKIVREAASKDEGA